MRLTSLLFSYGGTARFIPSPGWVVGV